MGETSTSDAEEIGRKIKFFRERKGWTQEVLAHEVGTSIAAISDYEKGTREMRVGSLCRIARALKCELSDLEPESVYNNSECRGGIDEVCSDIKHIYVGLEPKMQMLMHNQLQGVTEPYVAL